MYKKHVTRTGKEMFICQMTDSHLLNTTKHFLRRGEELKAVIRQDSATDYFLGNVFQVNDEQTRTKARAGLQLINEMLPFYLAEMVLRNLVTEEIVSAMQDLYEREDRVPHTPIPSTTFILGEDE